MTDRHKRWGFGLCFLYLRNILGFSWNHKRVYRIYRELELNLRIKPRKRLIREKPDKLKVPVVANDTWSMDFMAETLSNGRKFRTLNVLDDFNREGLGIEVDVSLPSARVIRSLDQIIGWRGKPKTIRCDNGPEYMSGEQLGLRSITLNLLLFNQASHSRMHTLNVITELCVMNGWKCTNLHQSSTLRRKQQNGYGLIIMKGLIWP